jgi:site-specific DNA-cytosine methylase
MGDEEQEKIKVLSLFSGYGTDNFALKRLGIPHEIIGYSDIYHQTEQVTNAIFMITPEKMK